MFGLGRGTLRVPWGNEGEKTGTTLVSSIAVLGTLIGLLDETIALLAFASISDALPSDFVKSIWIILVQLSSLLL